MDAVEVRERPDRVRWRGGGGAGNLRWLQESGRSEGREGSRESIGRRPVTAPPAAPPACRRTGRPGRRQGESRRRGMPVASPRDRPQRDRLARDRPATGRHRRRRDDVLVPAREIFRRRRGHDPQPQVGHVERRGARPIATPTPTAAATRMPRSRASRPIASGGRSPAGPLPRHRRPVFDEERPKAGVDPRLEGQRVAERDTLADEVVPQQSAVDHRDHRHVAGVRRPGQLRLGRPRVEAGIEVLMRYAYGRGSPPNVPPASGRAGRASSAVTSRDVARKTSPAATASCGSAPPPRGTATATRIRRVSSPGFARTKPSRSQATSGIGWTRRSSGEGSGGERLEQVERRRACRRTRGRG